jgi:hypothetical protein
MGVDVHERHCTCKRICQRHYFADSSEAEKATVGPPRGKSARRARLRGIFSIFEATLTHYLAGHFSPSPRHDPERETREKKKHHTTLSTDFHFDAEKGVCCWPRNAARSMAIRAALLFRLILLVLGLTRIAAGQLRSTAALATAGELQGPAALSSTAARVSKQIQRFRFNAPLESSKAKQEQDRLADDQVELELFPLALAVTIDGGVHALKRETGQWVWSLHSETAAGEQERAEPAPALRPLVSSRKGNASIALHPENVHGAGDDDEEVYVIEPHSGGYIYLWKRDGQRVQRLPLSIVELVDHSPFTFPGDDARMFVGRKQSSLIGVDLRSGKLVGDFGPEAGWCDWHDGDAGPASAWAQAECEESIEHRPGDLLYLGKTGKDDFFREFSCRICPPP